MFDFQDDHRIDALVAPARKKEIIKDRRRLGRTHDVSPALFPLLRNAATVAIVDDIYPIPVADVLVVSMPGATEGALQGNRLFGGSLGIWPGASLGIGILTAGVVWFATGHGSSISVALGNLLRFIYGIGMLM
jgi:hypothetical protein